MLKKKMKFEDFDGNEVEETHFFNLSKPELMEMELMGPDGSFTSWIQNIVDANDRATLFQEFKKLILASYGEKSTDGKSFLKNDELRGAFSQTAAFNALFMELATEDGAAVEFVRGIVPSDMASSVSDDPEAARAAIAATQATPPPPPAS